MSCPINCHYCDVGTSYTSYISACGDPYHPNVTPHSGRAWPVLGGHVFLIDFTPLATLKLQDRHFGAI